MNSSSNIEPLLSEENNRLTVYPIKEKKIWLSYKQQMASFWTAEEIDFSKDWDDFQKFLTGYLTPAKNVSHVKTALAIRSSKQLPGVPIDRLDRRS